MNKKYVVIGVVTIAAMIISIVAIYMVLNEQTELVIRSGENVKETEPVQPSTNTESDSNNKSMATNTPTSNVPSGSTDTQIDKSGVQTEDKYYEVYPTVPASDPRGGTNTP